MKFAPVIIIGAPRSGTNMLRNSLSKLPGWATWPCDEINYIWRYGNARFSSDVLTPLMARPNVVAYIRRQFVSIAGQYDADVVVEKTCANSLRVDFVKRVFPDAKFVFIYRDPYDAIGSATHRWRAGIDLAYSLRKARFVPLVDSPHYAVRYLKNRLYRLGSRDKRLAYWGPQLECMAEVVRNRPIEQVCAIQWRECVERALDGLEDIPADRRCDVQYEAFVKAPARELERITNSLNFSATSNEIDLAVEDVRDASIGKGKRELGKPRLKEIEPIVVKLGARLGYA